MAKKNFPLRYLLVILLAALGLEPLSAQQINITGTVTDPTGEPLIGVSVTVPGSKTGSTTDIDGNYSITADSKGIKQWTDI